MTLLERSARNKIIADFVGEDGLYSSLDKLQIPLTMIRKTGYTKVLVEEHRITVDICTSEGSFRRSYFSSNGPLSETDAMFMAISDYITE
jgi:hypothetical protein